MEIVETLSIIHHPVPESTMKIAVMVIHGVALFLRRRDFAGCKGIYLPARPCVRLRLPVRGRKSARIASWRGAQRHQSTDQLKQVSHYTATEIASVLPLVIQLRQACARLPGT